MQKQQTTRPHHSTHFTYDPTRGLIVEHMQGHIAHDGVESIIDKREREGHITMSEINHDACCCCFGLCASEGDIRVIHSSDMVSFLCQGDSISPRATPHIKHLLHLSVEEKR